MSIDSPPRIDSESIELQPAVGRLLLYERIMEEVLLEQGIYNGPHCDRLRKRLLHAMQLPDTLGLSDIHEGPKFVQSRIRESSRLYRERLDKAAFSLEVLRDAPRDAVSGALADLNVANMSLTKLALLVKDLPISPVLATRQANQEHSQSLEPAAESVPAFDAHYLEHLFRLASTSHQPEIHIDRHERLLQNAYTLETSVHCSTILENQMRRRINRLEHLAPRNFQKITGNLSWAAY